MTTDRRDFLALLAHAGLGYALTRRAAAADAQPDGWPNSPFLKGNYAPVHEEVTADDLKVVGKLPDGLDGLYVRNGPNPRFKPVGNYHWFDGDGMLHGVRVQGGKASYRNRYVRTRGWRNEDKAGKALFGGLADPPSPKRMTGDPDSHKNPANTALVWHDKKLLALWEGGEPHHVCVPDLDTVGPVTFGGKLRHPFTAHPKVDPVTGEMFCFGYAPVKPYCWFSAVSAQGELLRTQPIDLRRPVMMHDFALTEKYAVFLELPETFSFRRLMTGGPLLKFEPELGARYGIVPRAGGKVRWFEGPACFVFHTMNAHDDGDAVVLTACRFERFPEGINGGNGGSPPRLHRWRFDLTAGTVKEGQLDDRVTEFPRVNDRLVGRKNRYGYAVEDNDDLVTGVRKFDLQTGQAETHAFGPGRSGGEAVFVPKPDAKAEDDGWLLTYLYDKASGVSEMIVIEAGDVTAKPVARVVLPRRVPYGFHGTWVAGADLG